jgi:pyruvate/2-oxoglutarate dehydrogenase complex dihydrolipoamide dehydrogenase (E3) component
MASARDRYDVAVIGAGTAGMTAARLTAGMGHTVAMIEEERVGGECLYTGCVPSKALIESAKVFHQMRHAADYGLFAERIAVDFPAVLGRKDGIIAEIARGENAEVYRRIGIEVIEGRASFVDAHTLDLGGRRITAEHVVIATGSEENLPPIEGIRDIGVMTNIEVLQTTYDLPESAIILGGGPIGCEFAQIFARFGVPVTIVGRNQRLLPKEDPEMSALIRDYLTEEGITVLTGTEAKRAWREGEEAVVVGVRDGVEVTVRGAMVIAAAGRKARIGHLALEKAGVEHTPRGIAVQETLQTSVPHIWAAGDCTGLYQFTHVADFQGRLVAENIGKPGKRTKPKKADYRVVPWATFTDPEVARVGMTEEEARKEYGDKIEVWRWPFDRVDRALTMGETKGLIKVILGPKGILKMVGGGQILGAHIIGPHAGDVLHELVVTMQADAFAGRVAQAIHAYPTLALGVRQAVGQRWDAGVEPIDLD